MSQAGALALGLPVTAGFIVESVGAGSPAELAALQRNDVIVQIDSTPILSSAVLTQFLRDHPAGTVVTVYLWRLVPDSELTPDWEPVEVQVTLTDRPDSPPQ